MRFTGQKLSSTLLLGTALALTFAAPNIAQAQSSPEPAASETENTETPAIMIEADADADQGDTLPPAYAGGQVATGGRAGALGNKDVMETPFSTTSFTEELIKNQQAKDVSDVLENDASVVNTTGFGNFADRFTVRGFDLQSDDLMLDGLPGTAPRQKAIIEAYERVELFKGASAFLNGMPPGSTGIGGTVNLVPKRATDAPITSLTGTAESGGLFGTHADVSRRFGENNEYGVRTNVLYRDGGTGIENEEVLSRLASVGLDYDHENVRLSVDGIINQHYLSEGRPSVSIGSSLTAIPDAPSASHNYAASWTYADLEDSIAQARGEFDLTDDTMAYLVVGGRNTEENSGSSTPTLNDTDGSTSFGASKIKFQNTDLSTMAGIRHKLDTGPVSHELNFGTTAIWQKQRQSYNFFTSTNGNLYGSGPSSHLSSVTWTTGDLNDLQVTQEDVISSYFLSDTFGFFDDRILVTAGVRHQRIYSESYSATNGVQSANYKTDANTPIIAAIGNINDQWSVYANYAEGLNKGETVTSSTAANKGEVLEPYIAKQFETGVKADYGVFGGSVALFQIEKPSLYEDSTTKIKDTNGEQTNRGIELNAYGEPVEGIRILGSLTYTDSELSGTDGGTNDGHRAKGVAEYQATASIEYDLPFLKGATVSGRVIHSGPQFVDDENTLQLDEWTRLDLGGRYETDIYGYPVVWRANIENVTNNNYWASANNSSEFITMGAPMTAKLALTANF
ncbi:TonB-dependent receptor [Thalassospira povalilytica]|uniref:TonB-dependent receptor n=1 Tax=Thalassospira povalilytica TaxID=732237 RepID=UPI003AA9A72F